MRLKAGLVGLRLHDPLDPAHGAEGQEGELLLDRVVARRLLVQVVALRGPQRHDLGAPAPFLDGHLGRDDRLHRDDREALELTRDRVHDTGSSVISRRVKTGEMIASPLASSRTARRSSPGRASLGRTPLAPARRAARRHSSSSDSVKSITPTPEPPRVRQVPSTPGRLASSNTTSAPGPRARATASSPLPPSPVTAPLPASRSTRKPARTRACPSAITTRTAGEDAQCPVRRLRLKSSSTTTSASPVSSISWWECSKSMPVMIRVEPSVVCTTSGHICHRTAPIRVYPLAGRPLDGWRLAVADASRDQAIAVRDGARLPRACDHLACLAERGALLRAALAAVRCSRSDPFAPSNPCRRSVRARVAGDAGNRDGRAVVPLRRELVARPRHRRQDGADPPQRDRQLPRRVLVVVG